VSQSIISLTATENTKRDTQMSDYGIDYEEADYSGLETGPLAFTRKDWALDAADFMFPESTDDMADIGIAFADVLDELEWLDSTKKREHRAKSASRLVRKCVDFTLLLAEAAEANKLTSKMLEGLRDEK